MTSKDSPLGQLLTQGGDARILLEGGVNRYLATPYPRDTVTYASSTANDISAEAFAHLEALHANGVAQGLGDGEAYACWLDGIRARIRAAYGLTGETGIAFSASGTDLEFTALMAVLGRARGGVHNILLGANEVGTGCILSAEGRYFAHETPLTGGVEPGAAVPGMDMVTLAKIDLRHGDGMAMASGEIAQVLREKIAVGLAHSRHCLVHVVHGSKTGLILPRLEEIDALAGEFGEQVSFVVDACQARIGNAAVAAYLARGATVLLTGSKFMGGPTFSGFALLPPARMASLPSLPAGAASLVRRAEIPAGWPGLEALEASGNPGLALRLEAAVFELERFGAIPYAEVTRIIAGFRDEALRLVAAIGGNRVLPHGAGESGEAREHPIEMDTLVTVELGGIDIARATRIQRAMTGHGVRVGQPVCCTPVRFDEAGKPAEYRGTLRIGLSMPQVSRLAGLDEVQTIAALRRDMDRIAEAYRAALRETEA